MNADNADTESFTFESIESDDDASPQPQNSADEPFRNPRAFAIVPYVPPNASDGDSVGVTVAGHPALHRGGQGRAGAGAGRILNPVPKAKGKARAKAKAKASASASSSNQHGYSRIVRDAVTSEGPYQPRNRRSELRDDRSCVLLYQGYSGDPTLTAVELPSFETLQQFSEDFLDVKGRFKAHKNIIVQSLRLGASPVSHGDDGHGADAGSPMPVPGFFRFVGNTYQWVGL